MTYFIIYRMFSAHKLASEYAYISPMLLYAAGIGMTGLSLAAISVRIKTKKIAKAVILVTAFAALVYCVYFIFFALNFQDVYSLMNGTGDSQKMFFRSLPGMFHNFFCIMVTLMAAVLMFVKRRAAVMTLGGLTSGAFLILLLFGQWTAAYGVMETQYKIVTPVVFVILGLWLTTLPFAKDYNRWE